MASAVANYREILCNVERRWVGAIANGDVTEAAVIEELGIPAELVNAAVAEYKRVQLRLDACGSRRDPHGDALGAGGG